MTQAQFLAALRKTRKKFKWRVRTEIRCTGNLCPIAAVCQMAGLSSATSMTSYADGRLFLSLPVRSINLIMSAADGICGDVVMRRRLLAALDLKEGE